MSTQAKRIALDVMDWMWGTVQGAFNEKMNLSQIVTDAAIGMVPLVGDVTAARDLIAISLGLAGDEKKRDDKMQWLLLVIFVFALIPVVGGVIKGVGRLALRVTADVAKDVKVLEEVITFLNRIGHGNAVKWLKELDVLKYQGQVLERFNAFVDTMIAVLARIKLKLGSVLPASMVARLEGWIAGFKKVKEAGAKRIPEGVKELHARLQRLQQLVYRGEWHTVMPGTRNVTREAEARLIEESQIAAQASSHGGWKQNAAKAGDAATDADLAAIAKVYKWEDGYPELMKKIDATALEKDVYVDIAAFSGPIKASRVEGGEYLLRIHIPNTASRPWWVRMPHGVTEANWRDFMKGGKAWREGLGVLDEFSKNGAYSIVKIKPGHSIKAWEGKAAEQLGMANPGQYLPGGMTQLYLDTRAASFNDGVEWLVKEASTKWDDLEGVGYAAGNVKVAGAARVQRLSDDEDQTKRASPAGAH
jgi:hypothetical protein